MRQHGLSQRLTERVDVTEPAGISTGIAGRYATAIFELIREDGGLETLERDVGTIEALLRDSKDFCAMIGSPIYSREAQERAIAAVAGHVGLSNTMTKTLRLMASKRRLFVLPQLAAELRRRIAEERGEITAQVTAAQPLSEDQRRRLSETLKGAVGREVKLNVAVDPGLIGGLVLRVGSRMIDTSIRSKLAALQNTMKRAG